MSIAPISGIGYNTSIRQASKISNNQSFKGADNEETQGMSKTSKIATAIGLVGIAALAAFGVYKHRNAKPAAEAAKTAQQAAKNVERKVGNYSKLAGKVSETIKSVLKSSKKVANKDLKKNKNGLYVLKGEPYTGITTRTMKVKGKSISQMNEYSKGVLQKSYTLKGQGDNKFVKIATFDKEGKTVSTVFCSPKTYYCRETLADGKKVVTKAVNPGMKPKNMSAKKAKNVVWTSAGPVEVTNWNKTWKKFNPKVLG